MILCPYFPRMRFLITLGYSPSKIQEEAKPTYNTCHNMDPDFLESEHLFICRDRKKNQNKNISKESSVGLSSLLRQVV